MNKQTTSANNSGPKTAVETIIVQQQNPKTNQKKTHNSQQQQQQQKDDNNYQQNPRARSKSKKKTSWGNGNYQRSKSKNHAKDEDSLFALAVNVDSKQEVKAANTQQSPEVPKTQGTQEQPQIPKNSIEPKHTKKPIEGTIYCSNNELDNVENSNLKKPTDYAKIVYNYHSYGYSATQYVPDRVAKLLGASNTFTKRGGEVSTKPHSSNGHFVLRYTKLVGFHNYISKIPVRSIDGMSYDSCIYDPYPSKTTFANGAHLYTVIPPIGALRKIMNHTPADIERVSKLCTYINELLLAGNTIMTCDFSKLTHKCEIELLTYNVQLKQPISKPSSVTITAIYLGDCIYYKGCDPAELTKKYHMPVYHQSWYYLSSGVLYEPDAQPQHFATVQHAHHADGRDTQNKNISSWVFTPVDGSSSAPYYSNVNNPNYFYSGVVFKNGEDFYTHRALQRVPYFDENGKCIAWYTTGVVMEVPQSQGLDDKTPICQICQYHFNNYCKCYDLEAIHPYAPTRDDKPTQIAKQEEQKPSDKEVKETPMTAIRGKTFLLNHNTGYKTMNSADVKILEDKHYFLMADPLIKNEKIAVLITPMQHDLIKLSGMRAVYDIAFSSEVLVDPFYVTTANLSTFTRTNDSTVSTALKNVDFNNMTLDEKTAFYEKIHQASNIFPWYAALTVYQKIVFIRYYLQIRIITRQAFKHLAAQPNSNLAFGKDTTPVTLVSRATTTCGDWVSKINPFANTRTRNDYTLNPNAAVENTTMVKIQEFISGRELEKMPSSSKKTKFSSLEQEELGLKKIELPPDTTGQKLKKSAAFLANTATNSAKSVKNACTYIKTSMVNKWRGLFGSKKATKGVGQENDVTERKIFIESDSVSDINSSGIVYLKNQAEQLQLEQDNKDKTVKHSSGDLTLELAPIIPKSNMINMDQPVIHEEPEEEEVNTFSSKAVEITLVKGKEEVQHENQKPSQEVEVKELAESNVDQTKIKDPLEIKYVMIDGQKHIDYDDDELIAIDEYSLATYKSLTEKHPLEDDQAQPSNNNPDILKEFSNSC